MNPARRGDDIVVVDWDQVGENKKPTGVIDASKEEDFVATLAERLVSEPYVMVSNVSEEELIDAAMAWEEGELLLGENDEPTELEFKKQGKRYKVWCS